MGGRVKPGHDDRVWSARPHAQQILPYRFKPHAALPLHVEAFERADLVQFEKQIALGLIRHEAFDKRKRDKLERPNAQAQLHAMSWTDRQSPNPAHL